MIHTYTHPAPGLDCLWILPREIHCLIACAAGKISVLDRELHNRVCQGCGDTPKVGFASASLNARAWTCIHPSTHPPYMHTTLRAANVPPCAPKARTHRSNAFPFPRGQSRNPASPLGAHIVAALACGRSRLSCHAAPSFLPPSLPPSLPYSCIWRRRSEQAAIARPPVMDRAKERHPAPDE